MSEAKSKLLHCQNRQVWKCLTVSSCTKTNLLVTGLFRQVQPVHLRSFRDLFYKCRILYWQAFSRGVSFCWLIYRSIDLLTYLSIYLPSIDLLTYWLIYRFIYRLPIYWLIHLFIDLFTDLSIYRLIHLIIDLLTYWFIYRFIYGFSIYRFFYLVIYSVIT